MSWHKFLKKYNSETTSSKPPIPDRFLHLGTPVPVSHGSTAKVFSISKAYALKVIDCGTDPQRLEQAIHEIDIMQRLAHLQGTIHLLDHEIVETPQGTTVYLLETYHTPLPEFLRTHSPSPREILDIVIGVCASLSACLDAGILHLDVQPKNIFIDNPSTVFLGDFGSSLLREEFSIGMRGTKRFMAPEVYHHGKCSMQSDVYSVGLLLYTLFHHYDSPFTDDLTDEDATQLRLEGAPIPPLTGENTLFSGHNSKNHLAYRIGTVTSQAIANCRLNRIISKACAFQPEDRYHHPSEMKDALAELLEFFPTNKSANSFYSRFQSLLASVPRFDADSIGTSCALTDPPGQSRTGDDTVVPQSAGDPAASPGSHINEGPEGLAISYHQLGSQRPREWDKEETADTIPPTTLDQVEFSAVAPREITPGDYAMIHVVMYQPDFRDVVEKLLREQDEPAQEARSGIHRVRQEAAIRVVLNSPDLPVEDDTETGIWQGGHLDLSFDVCLPEDYAKHQILFRASVFIDDVIATRLKFIVRCSAPEPQRPTVERQDILSAFISYASQDRTQVATIIQGMQKVRPDLDIFLDVERLRSGEHWKQALCREIDRRDVLFLCWSHFASCSKYVDLEWHHALEQKGLSGIEPVPLELPKFCPPPSELEDLHFSDKLLYIILAENSLQPHEEEQN